MDKADVVGSVDTSVDKVEVDVSRDGIVDKVVDEDVLVETSFMHNDPEALKNGNRPLFRGLFLKPNCDQIGQKCLKFYFWTRQKTFQT